MKYIAIATIVLLLLPLAFVPLSMSNQPPWNVEFKIRPPTRYYKGPCIVSTEFPIDVYLWNDKTLTGNGTYAYDFYVYWLNSTQTSTVGLSLVNFTNHIPWPSGSYFLVINETGTFGIYDFYHLAVTAVGNATINPSLELGATGVFNASLVTLTFHIDKEPCWPDIYSTGFYIGSKLGFDPTPLILEDLGLAPIASTGCGQRITHLEIDHGKYKLTSQQPNIDPHFEETEPTTGYAENINITTAGTVFSVYIHLTNIVNAYGFGFTLTFDYNWKQTDIQHLTILPAFPPPYETLHAEVFNNTGVIEFELIRPCEKPTIHGADVPVVKIDFVETAAPILLKNNTIPKNWNSTISITDAYVLAKCGKLETDNRVYNMDQLNSVIAAADRLLALQNPTDFGWNWGPIPPGGATDANCYGVTAIDLIHAWELTGNEDYLDAAIAAGDYMAYGDPSAGDFFNGHGSYQLSVYDPTGPFHQASDYQFLMELSAATGDSSYADYALEAWAWQSAFYPGFFANGSQLALYNHYLNLAPFFPTDHGYAAWQMAGWGIAADLMGDTTWSNVTADWIHTEVPSLIAEVDGLVNYPYLGMGLALVFFTENAHASTAYAADITAMANDLKLHQQLNGEFFQNLASDPQTTAYAVMGLWAAGEHVRAQKGADWLVSTQQANGGWVYVGWGESSEVDSEAMSALMLPQDKVLVYSGDIDNNFRPKSVADLNVDGVVDIGDLSAVAKYYAKVHVYSDLAAPKKWAPVDIFDLVYVAKRYGDP